MDRKKNLELIAKKNGVSLSTVYRIMRGTGSRRNSSYESVRKDLSLVMSSRDTRLRGPVMMLTEDTLSSHALEFYEQLKRVCLERGIELVLTLRKFLHEDLQRNFAGIIAATTLFEPVDIPLVYLNRRSPTGRESSVSNDAMSNWLNMMLYLKEHGARRIGIFRGTSDTRLAYYLTAGMFSAEVLYRLTGMDYEPELVCPVYLTAETHAEGLRQAADYFASLKNRPDTILVETDFYIPKISQRLQEQGIRIPEDLLMAGVYSYLQSRPSVSHETAYGLQDEYRVVASEPCICGVHRFREMAETALDLLLEKISCPETPPRQISFSLKIQDYRQEH